MNRLIGPSLPDHLRPKDDREDEEEIVGPSLPPSWKINDDNVHKEDEKKEKEIIGPVLPETWKRKYSEDDEAKDDSKRFQENSRYIGPILPPGLIKSQIANDKDDNDLNVDSNLQLKESESKNDSEGESDDEFMIGPLPPCGNFLQVEESRHKSVNQEPSKATKGPQREEWIATCPENSSVARKLGFGKSVTSFSKKPVSNKEIEPVPQRTDLTEAIDEYNKIQRPKSLVEIHKKEQKKQKKDEPAPARQLFDFDPDRDLKVKQMNPEQTKSIMEKAKLLNSRFSAPRGTTKFL